VKEAAKRGGLTIVYASFGYGNRRLVQYQAISLPVQPTLIPASMHWL
jgi:hypothetical protein